MGTIYSGAHLFPACCQFFVLFVSFVVKPYFRPCFSPYMTAASIQERFDTKHAFLCDSLCEIICARIILTKTIQHASAAGH
jgi:hypothetical protein